MNKIIKEDLNNISVDSSLSKLKNKKVMIVGANGLIAKYFTYFLMYLNEEKNYNIKVIALARNLDKAKINFEDYLGNPNFELIQQDVCNPISYDGDVDYMIHAAGAASPKFIINDPVGIIKANTIGTINVLEFAKNKNVDNVLFTSTREVYGKVADDISLIDEDVIGSIDTLESRSCYPESKRVAETIFKAYYNQFNVPFTIARIAHTYGPTMEIKNDGRVMADFISCAVDGKDITLNSDGTAVRSFCYITDTVVGLVKILLYGKIGEAYNLANETEPYPIKEVATMLTDIFPEKNLKVVLNTTDSFSKGGYSKVKLIHMNTKKLESLGWQPKVKLVDGMRNTVLYFEEEKKRSR